MQQHGSKYFGNFRIEAWSCSILMIHTVCFQMNEVTNIQNFEKVRLLLSELYNSV